MLLPLTLSLYLPLESLLYPSILFFGNFFRNFLFDEPAQSEGGRGRSWVLGNLGTMVIELMLISGFGFSAIVGVALTGAVDEGAEKLKM